MPWRDDPDSFVFDGLSDQTLEHMRLRAEERLRDSSLNAAENGRILRFIGRVDAERAKREKERV